ncbi:PAP2 superfamily domain-containing protein [Trichoderma aethiopicum]
MGLFKNVIEPAAIVLVFTAGTILNRRRTKLLSSHHAVRDVETLPEYTCSTIEKKKKTDVTLSTSSSASSSSTESAARRKKKRQRGPKMLVFRVLSWICAKFPFLKEIWYWLLTYWVYQLSRALSARIIAPHPQIYLLAKHHALQLLSIEHRLHIDIEQSLQSYILTHLPHLMPILRHIYQSHIIVGTIFIVYTYTVLPPPLFRRIRRTIAMDNLIAFVIISLWRCYPPRMLPPEFGFVDILHAAKPTVWTDNRFRLTIAAMPSLHFGTSLFFAVCLARFSPHVLVRVLAPLWPLAMFVTVVATANHFVLDLVAGAVVPLLGWRWNRALLVLERVQEWVFAPLVERMDAKVGLWE